MSQLALSSSSFRSTVVRHATVLTTVPARAPACASCGARNSCLRHIDGESDRHEPVARPVRVHKGDVLVRDGDSFRGLITIRLGSCKSVVTTAGGSVQITGYHISGDLIGAGAIFTNRYDSTVIALEDTEFCVIPLERIDSFARENPQVHHKLHALLSREFGRERKVMLMLGMMRAEQRLVSFLLDLADRYAARGYSAREFLLRMTRE